MSKTAIPPSLIVPMNIAALCVGQTDVNGSMDVPYGTRDFARIASDFSNLPYLVKMDGGYKKVKAKANISEYVLPQFFDKVSEPLEEGIHLHWALPDALAHGSSDDHGNIEFPEAPNRWLVVRIASNHANSPSPVHAQKTWIIESDNLWDKEEGEEASVTQNNCSRAVPIHPLPDRFPNKAYRTMGRVFLYEAWSETTGGTYISKHTALGYGIPTYAAAYAHCRNVFAFYDALDDLDLDAFAPASSRISYMVTGWYSDSGKDPLARITYPDNADYDQKIAEIEKVYKWTFDASKNTSIPIQTLCNGLLCDITWDPENTHYIHKRSDTPTEVAIGNTTADALSALLAGKKEFASLDHVERLLNALQLGLLSQLDLPGGLAKLEEALHQRDFGSSTAGRIWLIKGQSSGDSQNGQPVEVTAQDLLDAASNIQQSLPEDLASDLNQLNICQQQFDKAQFEIESLRSQIFADWYKYMILEYPQVSPATDKLKADDAFYYIKDAIRALNSKLSESQQLACSLDTRKNELEGKLGSTYFLASVHSPRYWHSNDPVILLNGDDLQPSYRYSGGRRYNRRGHLVCRLSSSVISNMKAGSFTIRASDLPQLPSSPNHSYVAELNALMGEAFFLDPNQAWILAQAVAAQGGNENPAVTNLDTFVEDIQHAQQNLFEQRSANAEIMFAGTAPSLVGFQKWVHPWIPLLMQWEVYYYPFHPIKDDGGPAKRYESDFITSNYRLDDDDIDLVYQKPMPGESSELQIYQGMILLTHNTEINLKSQIDSYLDSYPDHGHHDELRTIRDNLNLPMVAQALNGFNQALIMRKQTLQLPVSDPLAIVNGYDHHVFSNVTVREAVSDQNSTAPMPHNSYNPLRGGAMKISRIRIIDAFGQIREIENPSVIRAESFIPMGDQPSNPMIRLRPRITQPSRLLFRWLSSDDDLVEMNSHPATTPICGWVMFNHLDSSLMIYNADGNALGSLDMKGPLWQGAPGNNDTFEQPIETVFAGVNSHLRNFALGIYSNPDALGFIRDLLAVIDRTLINVNPHNYRQHQGVSVLVGRPLALARALLKLELRGLPALNQSWAAFAGAVKNRTEPRDDAGFPRVEFPVRLGDLSQINDGLVGYFIDDGTENAYRTFFAAASQSFEHGVVPPAFDQLLVEASDDAPDAKLTMLVDPRAPIHATTGILPVKQIEIPPDMYAEALNRMAVTFLTTPVLSGAAKLTIPIPEEDGYDWSWVVRESTQWSVLSDIGKVSTEADLSHTPQRINEGWLRLYKRTR